MDNIVSLKNVCEELQVEFDVQPVVPFSQDMNERQRKIFEGSASVDERLSEIESALEEFNSEIDRLTNHADGMDYMVAVGSGVLAGIIDIIFVEDFSLDRANNLGDKKVDNFVIKIAKQQGYKGDDLLGAVRYLENKYPIAADKVTDRMGGGLQHHLRDFSHHPTPVGMIFSLMTQFTQKVYGTDTAGFFKVVALKKEDLVLIGKNIPEKITFGIIHWFFHMVSDMAGSSSIIQAGGVGTGLPGPMVSFLKEVSALPIFKKTNAEGYKEFSVWISKLFNGTLLGVKDENGKLLAARKFDLRTEIGVLEQVGQQAIPVIVNECIVRGFYFIRRFVAEIKNNNIRNIRDLQNIEWKNTLPFKNRTISRMLTISTGVMTTIDLASAAVESAIKSKGMGAKFVSNMIVKVNFVGVGRFALAVGMDVGMGIERRKKRNEHIVMMNEKIFLLNAKVFYKQADMWIAADNTAKTIEEAYEMMNQTSKEFLKAYQDIKESMKSIEKYIPDVAEKNPKLVADMKNILEWGIM